MTMKGFRRMVIIDQTMATNGGFVPHLVYENSRDMFPLGRSGGAHGRPWVWGPSIEEAKAQAVAYNGDVFGLTEDDATEILASVMAAVDYKEFPRTMAFVRDGEQTLERMRGYNIRFSGEDDT
jgi:hypothetical protein